MLRRLTILLVLSLLLTGCAKPTPPPPPAPDEPAPVSQPAELEWIELRYADMADLPPDVANWVDQFKHVPIGVARTFGDRTYLLVNAPMLCPEGMRVSIWSVQPERGGLLATAHFNCTRREWHESTMALASIAATELDIQFDLRYWWLPAFRNPAGLTEVPLPPDSRGVIVEPAAGSKADGLVTVRGFASGLFEGTVLARLVTSDGEVLTVAPTIAAGGMGPDWGSFTIELDLTSIAPGRYWLEVGDHDMRDPPPGQDGWQLMDRVEIFVGR